MSNQAHQSSHLVLGKAIERASNLVKLYSVEKIRLEDKFFSLIAPSGLGILGIQVKILNPDVRNIAIVVISFFLVYSIIQFWELYVAERRLAQARDVEVKLRAIPGNFNMPLTEFNNSDAWISYECMQIEVTKNRYCSPTGKLLIALVVSTVSSVILL